MLRREVRVRVQRRRLVECERICKNIQSGISETRNVTDKMNFQRLITIEQTIEEQTR